MYCFIRFGGISDIFPSSHRLPSDPVSTSLKAGCIGTTFDASEGTFLDPDTTVFRDVTVS